MLLNVNVAFLAVPGVDPGNHTRTPAQLASYLSIVVSLGSIVTGLLLLQQYRAEPEDVVAEVVSHLIRSLTHTPPLTEFGVFSVIGQVSRKPSSRCSWARNSSSPVQSAVFAIALGVSRDESVIVL